jgi:lysyl-tRNA synthetase class 2
MRTWERYKSDGKYRRNLEMRKRIMDAIRDFFARDGFVEIEAPLLVRCPDLSPNLSPFRTELADAAGRKSAARLITSPEFSMKKMLASGLPKIYSLGKVFRNNEPLGGSHNPEFTMLEWYRTGEDYRKMMDDAERLVKFCAERVDKGTEPLSFEKGVCPLNAPWQRLSVKEAFAGIGLDLDRLLTRDSMAKAAAERGYAVSPDDSFDDCFFKIFLTEIEPKLGQERPTFLYDYPIQMAALARAKPEDQRYAERFEVYANGLELANAFSELTDPAEQRRRFEAERKEFEARGKDAPPIDEDLLAALAEIGSAAGIALGVDRLVMLLTGAESIDDAILFPASELFGK